jgi:integral membrane protein (TIGR01906 family)
MRPLLRLLIVIAVPVILIVGAVRILTGPWFPVWEYRRPGFPDDAYGLEREERLRLAKASIAFLNLPRDLDRLRVLRLPDGDRAYNERELSHMDDVKQVYDRITLAALVALVVALVSGWLLYRRAGGAAVWGALSDGGLVTLMLLFTLGIWMLLSWEAFFTALHRLFFEGESWIFSYSDTLIRLFPMRFWQDAGIYVTILVAGSAFLIALVGRMMSRRLLRERAVPDPAL